MSRAAALFMAAALVHSAMAQAPDPVFRTGTRLVEVDVTIRDQPIRPPGAGALLTWVFDSGPPFGPPGLSHAGLTKDDFILLDDGRPQPIAVFRTGQSGTPSSDGKPIALPPGAVSNRQDTRGQPVNGATAVLIDFLNTNFGCRGYEQMGMTNFLRSFANTDDRIALYALGEKLHILHDFTDQPQKLIDTAATLAQPRSQRAADLESALRDLGDIISVGDDQDEAAAVHGPMTVNALKFIIRHLAGVPGRKNLVWLMEDPRLVPPATLAMAQQANVVLYPVLVRLVGSGLGPDASCVGSNIALANNLAAVTGGRAFFDAKDLSFAVRATQEDTSAAYVLGYYPPQEMLDGKYHVISVKLRDKALQKQNFEIHYRPGYIATKVAAAPPPPSLAELFYDPLEYTSIGLAGQVVPQVEHPGLYDVRLTVDLHDIHLERKNGKLNGAFDLSIPNPASKGTAKTVTFALDFTDAQLAGALEQGGTVTLAGVEAESGKIRVAVRDRATGATGSLLFPVEQR
jgi:VWFA-related protein